MRQKRLFIVLAVLALVTMVGATAAFAAGATVQPSQQTATDEVGLVIVAVDPAGPAAAAGVSRGDILLAIGAQDTNRAQDVAAAVADLTAGDKVDLVVTHGDDERTLSVTVGEQNGRAYLGIQPYYGFQRAAMAPIDRFMPAAADGARVMEVVADSPAASAGLQTGDVILSVNGEALAEDTTLADAIGALAPGDTATLEVQRAGEDATLSLDVTLAENPDKAGVAFLGVQYGPAMSTTMETMPFFHGRGMPAPGEMPGLQGMPDFDSVESGVAVVSVAADSPAEAAGLVKGDVIVAVDGQDVATPEDVVAIVGEMKPGDTVTLSVQAQDAEEANDVEVTLAARPDDATRAFLGVSLGMFQSMRSQQIVPGQGQFQFELPSDQGNGTTPPSQGQMPSLPDLLQQLFPGMTSQQNS